MTSKAHLTLSRTALATCLAGVAVVLVAQQQSSYDIAASRTKLEAIGRAIAAYRESHPAKPVANRKSPTDAGLPSGLRVLAEPGKPWTLKDGMKALQVEKPNEQFRGEDLHFTLLYWSSEEAKAVPALRDMSDWFAARGEDLPIVADFNAGTVEQWEKRKVTVVILRLSGIVDTIEYDPGEPWRAIWRK